jgi:hypothetical protein
VLSFSPGGERSSAGRASVCGTEGRGFKSHRSPHSFQPIARIEGIDFCTVFAQSCDRMLVLESTSVSLENPISI